MELVYNFAQHGFWEEGVCFRETFKWLACKIYGRRFIFNPGLDGSFPEWQLDGRVRGLPNYGKVWKKQAAYLDPIRPYEGPGAPFGPFIMAAHANTLEKLRAWGNKLKNDSVKYALQVTSRTHTSLASWRRAPAGSGDLIGIFGTSTAGPWGHAVAFYEARDDPRFFDANYGELSFKEGEDPRVEIERHLRKGYEGPSEGVTYAIKFWMVYRMSRTGIPAR